MRRDLLAASVVCSLLWAVCGVSVLAVALHEHVDHAEPHDHDDVIQTVLHGHAHGTLPDHDHELTTLVGFSRYCAAPYFQGTASQSPGTEHCCEPSLRVGGATESCAPDFGRPPYVMHCVLLT